MKIANFVRPSDANKTERSSKIVTDSLGFRLEVEISFEEIAGSGITYEREGAVTEDCLHKIMINRSLFGPEIAEVIAHEVYHLFYSVRPLIKADEETEATVFGQLVGRIHCLAAPAHDCNHGQIPDVSILIAQLEAFHRDSVAHHSAQLQQLGGRIKELEGVLQAIADEANSHHEYNLVGKVSRLPIGYTKILSMATEAIEGPDAEAEALRPAQKQAIKH